MNDVVFRSGSIDNGKEIIAMFKIGLLEREVVISYNDMTFEGINRCLIDMENVELDLWGIDVNFNNVTWTKNEESLFKKRKFPFNNVRFDGSKIIDNVNDIVVEAKHPNNKQFNLEIMNSRVYKSKISIITHKEDSIVKVKDSFIDQCDTGISINSQNIETTLKLSVIGTQIINNKQNGFVINSQSVDIDVEHSTFKSNEGSDGAGIYVVSTNELSYSLVNTDLIDNKGTVLFVDANEIKRGWISNCDVTYNNGREDASALLYIEAEKSNMTIDHSHFETNQILPISLKITNNLLSIRDSTFKENVNNDENVFGGVIYVEVSEGVDIRIRKTSFIENMAGLGGVFYIANPDHQQSPSENAMFKLNVADSTFSNNYATKNEGAVLYHEECVGNDKHYVFENNVWHINSKVDAFSFKFNDKSDSELFMNGDEVATTVQFGFNGIHRVELDSLNIHNEQALLDFHNIEILKIDNSIISADTSSEIFVRNVDQLFISLTKFEKNYRLYLDNCSNAEFNGGHFISGNGIDVNSFYNLKFDDYLINGNTNNNGGALSVSLDKFSRLFEIVHTEISENTAAERGGGIYFLGKKSLKSFIRIDEETTISQNNAKWGGGIYWGDIFEFKNITNKGLTKGNSADNSGGGMYIESETSIPHFDDLKGKLEMNKAKCGDQWILSPFNFALDTSKEIYPLKCQSKLSNTSLYHCLVPKITVNDYYSDDITAVPPENIDINIISSGIYKNDFSLSYREECNGWDLKYSFTFHDKKVKKQNAVISFSVENEVVSSYPISLSFSIAKKKQHSFWTTGMIWLFSILGIVLFLLIITVVIIVYCCVIKRDHTIKTKEGYETINTRGKDFEKIAKKPRSIKKVSNTPEFIKSYHSISYNDDEDVNYATENLNNYISDED